MQLAQQCKSLAARIKVKQKPIVIEPRLLPKIFGIHTCAWQYNLGRDMIGPLDDYRGLLLL